MTLAINQSAAVSSAAASAAATSAGAGATPAVNQQQFMQLLIAQLKHQDPTQPVQGTEFVTQLAQFSLVEQSVNQTQQLGNINTQVAGLSNDAASQLVGKTVTLNGTSTSFNGTVATPANATLQGPAAQILATITDSNGNVIRTLNVGPHAAGPITVAWDGRDNSGQPAPIGAYAVGITAADSNGGPVNVSQNVTGVVANVSFANGSPEITLASGATAPVSQVVGVGTPTSL
jgi:flagellar basal-body rod modification protein FlgD